MLQEKKKIIPMGTLKWIGKIQETGICCDFECEEGISMV
jgi:hypothetical protein